MKPGKHLPARVLLAGVAFFSGCAGNQTTPRFRLEGRVITPTPYMSRTPSIEDWILQYVNPVYLGRIIKAEQKLESTHNVIIHEYGINGMFGFSLLMIPAPDAGPNAMPLLIDTVLTEGIANIIYNCYGDPAFYPDCVEQNVMPSVMLMKELIEIISKQFGWDVKYAFSVVIEKFFSSDIMGFISLVGGKNIDGLRKLWADEDYQRVFNAVLEAGMVLQSKPGKDVNIAVEEAVRILRSVTIDLFSVEH